MFGYAHVSGVSNGENAQQQNQRTNKLKSNSNFKRITVQDTLGLLYLIVESAEGAQMFARIGSENSGALQHPISVVIENTRYVS